MGGGVQEAWEELLAKLEASREEARQLLGDEKAFHILNVHVKALLEAREAIEAACGPEERANSLLYAQIPSLLAELSWAQLAFLSTHYPSACRCLRSALELSCRSRLADLAYPAEPAQRKLVKAALLERKRRRWPKGWRLVKKTLESLSAFELEREELLRLRKAWKTMNKYAHAYLTAWGEGSGPWRPWIPDEQMATSILQISDAVSDAILLLLLDAFPRIRERIAAFLSAREWKSYLPMTYRYLKMCDCERLAS